MSVFAVVLTALVASVALPDLGRPLNLAGARLAAAEPSETIIAAMIAAPGIGPQAALETAWDHFGRGLDYRRWRFRRASFDDATMQRIMLDGADLSGASLIRANMTRARLQGTVLAGAVLSEANLHSADLTCANVPKPIECLNPPQAAKAAPADAPSAPSAAGTKLAQAGKAAPTGAAPGQTGTDAKSASSSDVCSATRNGPRLNNVNIAAATLTSADLSGGSLRSVDFTQVKEIANAVFMDADLRDANFKGMSDLKVDFSRACLCGADFSKANLKNAKLSGAILRNANLSGATLPQDLQGIDFSGANVKGTKFEVGAKDEPPNLQNANLTKVVQTDEFNVPCDKAATPATSAIQR
jgi:uncharacterized protein YjbI with pentapeptide repeats